jgi:hypothetical protein
MQKISTAQARGKRIFKKQLTIGLDLGDRCSSYCVLDEAGEIVLEQKLPTTPEAMKKTFGRMLRSRVAMETGTHLTDPLASFLDSFPQLAPIASPSIFDLLFCRTPIVGGGDQGQCALDTNQNHGSDFNGESRVPVHLAPALEDLIRAMDNRPPLESMPFANKSRHGDPSRIGEQVAG